MRNNEYVVYLQTKQGRAWRYTKDQEGWAQTTPAGKVRRMTAEQLLSHLLPPLAKDQPNMTVRVEHK